MESSCTLRFGFNDLTKSISYTKQSFLIFSLIMESWTLRNAGFYRCFLQFFVLRNLFKYIFFSLFFISFSGVDLNWRANRRWDFLSLLYISPFSQKLKHDFLLQILRKLFPCLIKMAMVLSTQRSLGYLWDPWVKTRPSRNWRRSSGRSIWTVNFDSYQF